ncbi:adenosylhomocysteinase [Motilibacter rhizosphaerae]|uniref:Adenosylhomocysteinase n=1 Tax=Motilibacter rhizosphaerae TaxID=598652 RepID=A0A4V2F4Q6_9ACTN|nr:adenosylhomocysteinase [Motilibacter rhizosphaerae]RZS90149.1 adenosylhomocysteinase [Motilibacter rhizosphaerae]
MTARRIEHSARSMPVLSALRDRWAQERPLEGVAVAACLPVTAETAVLVLALQAAGAAVALCSSNPLSTQDDVARALHAAGVAVRARRGASRDDYYAALRGTLDELADARCGVLLDDGCDLLSTLHDERADLLAAVPLAASEQTASGALRLRRLAAEGLLRLPVVAVDGSRVRRVVDTRWGSGQATVDALLRGSGLLIAGKTAVVAGYGDVGRAVATRLRGMGAHVVVTEVDPVAALEAVLEGHRVLPMADAVREADLVVTATGGIGVVAAEHVPLLRDGVVLVNAGHFDVEVDVAAVAAAGTRLPRVRPSLDTWQLPDGRRVSVLAEGRVAGLAAAEGSPPEAMDVAFALQALVVRWLVEQHPERAAVLPVPPELDARVAELALAALSVRVDVLSEEQRAYLSSWRSGS